MEQSKWDTEYVPIICKGKEDNKQFVEWVKSKGTICVDMLFDARLWYLCYKIRHKIRTNDTDYMIVVAGLERSGKSTLLMKMLALINENLQLKDTMCYAYDDFTANIKKLNEIFKTRGVPGTKGNTLDLDEGALLLFSKNTMSKESKEVVQYLHQCGQLNLCIGICIPRFVDLDKYIREHRVQCYIKILGKDTRKYQLFLEQGIKIMNDNKKVPLRYSWKGWFSESLPTIAGMDKEKYKIIKGENFSEFVDNIGDKKEGKKKLPVNFEPIEIADRMKKFGIPYNHIATILELHPKTVASHVKNYRFTKELRLSGG